MPKVPDLYGDTDPLDDFASSTADPFGGFPGVAASNGAPSTPPTSAFDDWGMPAPVPAATKPVSSQNRSVANEGRGVKPADAAPAKAADAPKVAPVSNTTRYGCSIGRAKGLHGLLSMLPASCCLLDAEGRLSGKPKFVCLCSLSNAR